MTKSVMFYVQHLLGIGHVRRAAVITRAISAAGLDVAVVLGGRDVPGADFGDAALARLPAARAADETFSVLLDENDEPIDDAWRDRRRAALFSAYERIRPDILIFEAFPFGRRQFRFEIVPLLEKLHNLEYRPHIVSSVRDILVRKHKPQRYREVAEMAVAWFDTILVHGDPGMVTLEATFPESAAVRDRVRYTGYVMESKEIAVSEAGKGEIVVSVGGGAMGMELLRTALAARPLTRAREYPWRLLTGPNLPVDCFREIKALAPEGVIVEKSRLDFHALLANCRLSISQGGYNTVMDVLKTGANAIIVPFSGADETEQSFRARLLEERRLVRLIEAEDLDADRLARAVDAALEEPPEGNKELDFSGAATTARIIAGLTGVSGKSRLR